MQRTWREIHHIPFLEFIGSSFRGNDTATYIAKNYSWESDAWFWTRDIGIRYNNLNNWVTAFGDSKGAFLLTQYWVNSWQSGVIPFSEQIGDGAILWNIQNERLFVNGVDVAQAPLGWGTPITGSEDSYHEVMEIFGQKS
ncbi:MAG: hypothetical protein FWE02_00765 [Defluviitaleaceae bacterium]|nr:hypothetical protein [Defluviitaleaceae bacterium]